MHTDNLSLYRQSVQFQTVTPFPDSRSTYRQSIQTVTTDSEYRQSIQTVNTDSQYRQSINVLKHYLFPGIDSMAYLNA